VFAGEAASTPASTPTAKLATWMMTRLPLTPWTIS